MTQRFGLPKWVWTDNPDNPFGQSRLQVDVGQTGFFTGREFRTFYEFSIPTAQTIYIKAVANTDTFVQQFLVDLFTADLRVELIAGGTEGGTFSTSLPILRVNGTNTSYESQVVMSTGGTQSGGVVQDVIQLYAVSNPAKGSAVEVSTDSVLGFPAGTFYIKLQNINSVTATGIFKARWEERPEGV
jgi:hypothetical protein